MNKWIGMGRLVREPEQKTTTSGKTVTNFTLAIDRGYGDKKETDFINCIAWEKTGEFVSKYFNKGNMILVEGELNIRSYDDKEGKKKYITEINVNRAHFSGEKKSDTAKPTPSGGELPEGFTEVVEEELPF